MRRRDWMLVLLLGLLVLTGCGRAAEELPEETPPPAVEDVEPVETPEEPDPNALTAEEIARVNEAFASDLDEEGVCWPKPISCFFQSFYERPEDIDLGEFLRHFSPGSGVPDASEEMDALARAEDWPFPEELDPHCLPCPTHKYLRADVDACLMKYAGITTAELSGVRCGETAMVYLEAYDAYYNFVSDFGPGWFACQSGTWEDENTVRLTSVHTELVLERRDGAWYIVSHLPLEK